MKRKLLAALAVPGLILGGAVAVNAQTADDTTVDTTADTTTDSATTHEHAEGQGRHGRGGHLIEALGLDRATVQAGIAEGSTLAELAEAAGVDVDAAIDTLVAEAEAKVAENPDSRFAENFDADTFRERLTATVNGEIELGRGGRGGEGRGPGGGLGQLTEALGMDKAEIREALADGSTIAELAETAGVDIDAVIASIVADAEAKVAEHPDSRFAENFDAEALTERLEGMVSGEVEFPSRGHGHSAGSGQDA
jgi:hypothetical protein